MLSTVVAPWATFFLIYVQAVSAHMAMIEPAPINHPKNPFATATDYDYNNPLASNGADFPCKGQHALLDRPEGQPVAQWQSGQTYSMTIDGGAFHSGGSCQASLSFDGGRTFKAIHSYVGGCPSGQGRTSYRFALPADTPSTERAIFAWTWFNNLGNREMYMNCAAVSISGGGGGRGGGSGLANRPDMFVANVGNGCSTVESRDVMFPDPGRQFSVQGSNTAPPTGSCASGPGLGSPGDGGPGDTDRHRPGQSSPGGGTPEECPAPTDENPSVDEHSTVREPEVPGQWAPETTRYRPVTNYVPGNDWPQWYNGADRLKPRLLNVALLRLGMVGVLCAFRQWVV